VLSLLTTARLQTSTDPYEAETPTIARHLKAQSTMNLIAYCKYFEVYILHEEYDSAYPNSSIPGSLSRFIVAISAGVMYARALPNSC
jgi:hypothetical protein